MRARIGISLPIPGHSVLETIEVARRLEQLGLSDLWSSEVGGHDAFTPLAAAAARTSTVRLGTAVVPAYTRPPALLAMTAASLAELSGGRFCLGIGSSTEAIVRDWMGLEAPHPLSRMKETIEAFRLAIAGDKVEYRGTTLTTRGFRLQATPVGVPVMAGALGPLMFRLAGEIADGVIMTMAAPSAIRALLEDFRAGAEAAGKPNAGEVVLQQWVQLGGGSVAPYREVARASIAAYGIVPVYNRYLARQGFEAEAERLRLAWTLRSRAEARLAVSDAMVDALCIAGDDDYVLQRLDELQLAGITTIVLNPIVGHADAPARSQLVAALRRILRDWGR